MSFAIASVRAAAPIRHPRRRECRDLVSGFSRGRAGRPAWTSSRSWSADVALARIITIDGPSGSGKGTISPPGGGPRSAGICSTAGRSTGWWRYAGPAARAWIPTTTAGHARIADATWTSQFGRRPDGRASRSGSTATEVSQRIRTRAGGRGRLAGGRHARGARGAAGRASGPFARPPGLVADGRDMGTVIFPEAPLKIFLTASAGGAGPAAS